MDRRAYFKELAAGTIGLFVLPAALTSCEDDLAEPDLGNTDPDEQTLVINLQEDNNSKLLEPGGFLIESGVILINTGDGIIALSSACTHSGCPVSYDHEDGNLPCPCHGSVFSTAGAVLNGPADAPLQSYEVSREGDVLTVTL